MIPGIASVAGVGFGQFRYIGTATWTGSATSVTFDEFNIGDHGPDRRVYIFVVLNQTSGTSPSMSNVTLDGDTAGQTSTSIVDVGSGVFMVVQNVRVDSGDVTGRKFVDVVITSDKTFVDCQIFAFGLEQAPGSGTAVGVEDTTVTSSVLQADIDDFGGAIPLSSGCYVAACKNTAVTHTWSGQTDVVEHFDAASPGNLCRITVASSRNVDVDNDIIVTQSVEDTDAILVGSHFGA